MLIIVCGLPGTGKSTLAKALAKDLNAEYINSDTVRKRIFENPKYTEEEKTVVYTEMKEQAEKHLKDGKNVILDATFFKRRYRKMMYDLVPEQTFFVKCRLPEDEIKKRLELRKQLRNDPSDADYRVYTEVKEEFESLNRPYLEVDCSMEEHDMIALVRKFIGERK